VRPDSNTPAQTNDKELAERAKCSTASPPGGATIPGVESKGASSETTNCKDGSDEDHSDDQQSAAAEFYGSIISSSLSPAPPPITAEENERGWDRAIERALLPRKVDRLKQQIRESAPVPTGNSIQRFSTQCNIVTFCSSGLRPQFPLLQCR
jgi:hypothetical protein